MRLRRFNVFAEWHLADSEDFRGLYNCLFFLVLIKFDLLIAQNKFYKDSEFEDWWFLDTQKGKRWHFIKDTKYLFPVFFLVRFIC